MVMEYDKEKHIVFRISGPTAGVANRMHGYCHAKIFSDLTNKKLLIHDNHRGFRNKTYKVMSDIFEIDFEFIKRRSTLGLPSPWDSAHKEGMLQRLNLNLSETEYCKMFLDNFLDFKFAPAIQLEADKFIQQHLQLQTDIIGVHIRTERGRAKARYFSENDVETCVIQIQKFLHQYNLNSVFITGGKMYNVLHGIKEKLIGSGVNVISDETSTYARDSVEWLRDMEILSRCKFVMGHYHSTYATASARIKAKDFIDLKIGEKVIPPYTH